MLEDDLEIPDALVSLVRLLSAEGEWEKAKGKGKPPKPKIDMQVLSFVSPVLQKRLCEYATSLEVVHWSYPISSYVDVPYSSIPRL